MRQNKIHIHYLLKICSETVATNTTVAALSAAKAKAASQPDKPKAPAVPFDPAVGAADIPGGVIVQGSVDTLKGVRAGSLYEPGHSVIGADLCPNRGENLRLMILITSAPAHRDARLSIRQTWGSYATRRDVGLGFILGSTQSVETDEALETENGIYGDIIRGRFLDTYNNLTLKTISCLEWMDEYCPKVQFFLKTDDDMFINMPKLLTFMEKHKNEKNVIYGRLAKKWKPIRNKKSKYYVSPQQYFPPVFPAFTTGPAYLMTTEIVHDLYSKALNQTYLKLEDVFTTGIVAQLVNVKRVHVNEFLNRRIAFNPCNIRRIISVHMVKSNEQFDLWKKLLDTGTKCK